MDGIKSVIMTDRFLCAMEFQICTPLTYNYKRQESFCQWSQSDHFGKKVSFKRKKVMESNERT